MNGIYNKIKLDIESQKIKLNLEIKKGYKKIQISKIPNFRSGIAINDRIKRASRS